MRFSPIQLCINVSSILCLKCINKEYAELVQSRKDQHHPHRENNLQKEQWTLIHLTIVDTCEIIINNHTCEIIVFISGGNINKTLLYKLKITCCKPKALQVLDTLGENHDLILHQTRDKSTKENQLINADKQHTCNVYRQQPATLYQVSHQWSAMVVKNLTFRESLLILAL